MNDNRVRMDLRSSGRGVAALRRTYQSKTMSVAGRREQRFPGRGFPRRFCGICAALILYVAVGVGASAQTLTTLLDFYETIGTSPYGTLVQGIDGNLYGTTLFGGTNCPPNGCGTVFKVTPTGVLTTLYNFCSKANCADGSYPEGGVVLGTDTNLYGTTGVGGANNGGTVFKITPQGTLTILYSFCAQVNCADGKGPNTETLFQAANRDFYGTTSVGGAHSEGTVFKITPQGKLTTLYSFCAQSGCSDGSLPIGGVILGTDSNLYGTTLSGGGTSNYGTVFKLSLAGKLTTLHRFQLTDGANPAAPLLQGSNGIFYGSTQDGGEFGFICNFGCGTLFEITSTGTFTVLDRFLYTLGFAPYAGMIQATDGNLYGTTVAADGYGSIYDLSPAGNVNVDYLFSGAPNGEFPYAGLVQASSGIFYGTNIGGTNTAGTAFSFDVGLGPFVAFIRSSGKVGATAKILGQGFTGTSSVTFNGVRATSYTVVSDTYLKAQVPSGATTGTVVVITPTGTLKSNVNFRVTK